MRQSKFALLISIGVLCFLCGISTFALQESLNNTEAANATLVETLNVTKAVAEDVKSTTESVSGEIAEGTNGTIGSLEEVKPTGGTPSDGCPTPMCATNCTVVQPPNKCPTCECH